MWYCLLARWVRCWPQRHGRARLGWALFALLSPLLLLWPGAAARAHDLAIDQLMLWPDRAAGELRGELTIDPELTREKDARPDAASARRAIEFLAAHLALSLDGRAAPLAFEVRELWERGGATLGDVVRFSTPLAGSVRELRVRARGFPALVVSVQQRASAAPGQGATPAPSATPMETTSWLLSGDGWTPAYRLDGGWQASGWRSGGPDVFAEVSGALDAVGALPGEAGEAPPRLGPAAPEPIEAAWTSAARFVRIGFEHIVPDGVDHLLFVAGLVLARARRFRQVLVSLSLFTVAHTLTLALGHFQLVRAPSGLIEPLIALSIMAVGLDNLRAPRPVEARAWLRYAVVFGFGLVHGLGFASALSELSLDRERLLLALFCFNLGVELGQVAVAASLLLAWLAARRWATLERYATLAGSAAIAAAGLLLVIDRAVGAEPAAALVGASASAAPALAAPTLAAPALAAPNLAAPALTIVARPASPTPSATGAVSNRASP